MCVHGTACAWRSELVISYGHGFQGPNRLPGFHGRCFYPRSHFASLRNKFSKGLRTGKEPSISDRTQSWVGGSSQILVFPCSVKAFLTASVLRTLTAVPGSLLLLDMVRARRGWGWSRAKKPGQEGPWHCPCPSPAGLKTGRCLRVGNSTQGTCEIFAWCPVETMSMPT